LLSGADVVSGVTSYVRRRIDLTFGIGTGNGGEGTPTTFTVKGLRVSVEITKNPTVIPECSVRVRGLTEAHMNALSTLGMLPTAQRRNTITIQAGDDTSGMFQIYSGTIQQGWVDHSADPDTVFNVVGNAAAFVAVNPAAPSSFTSNTDVAQVMSGLASAMGLQFENGGVSVILAHPYFPGTLLQQVQRAAEAANINWIIDNGILAIWPLGASRVSSGSAPLISPQTGMAGYPAYTSTGVAVRALFNPSIRPGASIQVQSSLTPACGQWTAMLIKYTLESETPSGAWFQEMLCVRPWLVPAGVIASPSS
jgi:baseplate hub protein gp41